MLAEFEDPVATLRQRDTTVSWREEDLVAHEPAQPSGISARKSGRPPGSKNRKPSGPPAGVRLEASDDTEEDEAPVARRTRSRGKTQQVSMVSQEPEEDPNYGIWLEF